MTNKEIIDLWNKGLIKLIGYKIINGEIVFQFE